MAAGFRGIVGFIEEARQAGGVVYVHCGAGISRAPTAAAAYLIWKLRLSAAAAISLLRRSRPCARPNVGFVNVLKAWEVTCCALPLNTLPADFKFDAQSASKSMMNTAIVAPEPEIPSKSGVETHLLRLAVDPAATIVKPWPSPNGRRVDEVVDSP
eukprot:scaffold73059_cov30-Tisochrysis_lutea.AAC.1